MDDARQKILSLDYEETGRQHRALADVRFKLLAITPALLGAGFIATLSKAPASPSQTGLDTGSLRIAVGLLGGFTTLGLIVYELRNTQLYDHSVKRLRWLEREPGFPSLRGQGNCGGVHEDRPDRLFPIVHDIYATSLAGWAYLLGLGLGCHSPAECAACVGLGCFAAFLAHDWYVKVAIRRRPEPPNASSKEAVGATKKSET